MAEAPTRRDIHAPQPRISPPATGVIRVTRARPRSALVDAGADRRGVQELAVGGFLERFLGDGVGELVVVPELSLATGELDALPGPGFTVGIADVQHVLADHLGVL